jgi:hypothetical protein
VTTFLNASSIPFNLLFRGSQCFSSLWLMLSAQALLYPFWKRACDLGASINSEAERERAGCMLDNVPAIPLDVFEPNEVETVVQVARTFQQVQIEVPVAFTANSEDTLPFRPWTQVAVLGDGYCLFRSISYLLAGSEVQHVAIRNLVCTYVCILS